MAGKAVIAAEQMEEKIRAAAAARMSADFFLLARTDALEPEGVDEALRRGERYLKAGADGIYVEGPRNEKEIEQIGKTFKGEPLATSVLEAGGKTPWLEPEEFRKLGYSMILYPTTVLFRLTRSIERALEDLMSGRQMPKDEAVNMEVFEEIVDLQHWAEIENRFQGGQKQQQ